LLRLFDNPLEVAEFATQLCVCINSLAVLVIGMRLRDRLTGVLASALYACSALVFKYHMFEREIFASTCILMGLCCWLVIHKGTARAILTGVLFCAASLIKLTSVVPFVGMLLWLLAQKRYREGAIMLTTYGLLLAGCTALLYLIYGRDFFFQVFVFHFMKGYRSLPGRVNCFVENTDFTVFFGILGLLFYRDRHNRKQWSLLKLLMISYPVFFICFSSTVWPHNLIEMLIFASLLGGAYIRDAIGQAALGGKRSACAAIVSPRVLLTVVTITAIFCIAKPWEIEGAHKKLNNYYGFGSVPRKAIKDAAAFIREHTGENEYICCHVPLVAFASGRKKVIHYWESVGVEAWLQEHIAEQGIWETFRETKNIRFVEFIAETSSGHAEKAFRRQILQKKPALIVRPDFRGEESFAARLANGIMSDYAGAVQFRNQFFEISEFRPRVVADE
jgi:hypothetical protein